MKLTWKDNTARIGGVEFRTWNARGQIVLHCRVLLTPFRIDGAEYFDAEAEARAAAEKIAKAIFGGEEVWRLTIPGPVEKTSEPRYAVWPSLWPSWYKRQRGLFVPMEGE